MGGLIFKCSELAWRDAGTCSDRATADYACHRRTSATKKISCGINIADGMPWYRNRHTYG